MEDDCGRTMAEGATRIPSEKAEQVRPDSSSVAPEAPDKRTKPLGIACIEPAQ